MKSRMKRVSMRFQFHITNHVVSSISLMLLASILVVDVIAAFITTTSSSMLRMPTPPAVLSSITAISSNRFESSNDPNASRNSVVLMAGTEGIVEAWEAYNHALELHPLIVKSVTASIILGLGDFAGQAVQNLQVTDSSKKGVDYSRAARFAIFGLVLQAPWNHYYYLLLDGQIPPTVDEPFSLTNIMKVGIDQLIQAPIFTVLIFIFLGILEGKALDDIKKQLQSDYPETIVANWKLWIPATVINIAFIPPLFRVLYLNCVFFFWSIYLSLVLNKEEEVDLSV